MEVPGATVADGRGLGVRRRDGLFDGFELANGFACKRCGATLGEPALSLSDELWARHMDRLLS